MDKTLRIESYELAPYNHKQANGSMITTQYLRVRGQTVDGDSAGLVLWGDDATALFDGLNGRIENGSTIKDMEFVVEFQGENRTRVRTVQDRKVEEVFFKVSQRGYTLKTGAERELFLSRLAMSGAVAAARAEVRGGNTAGALEIMLAHAAGFITNTPAGVPVQTWPQSDEKVAAERVPATPVTTGPLRRSSLRTQDDDVGTQEPSSAPRAVVTGESSGAAAETKPAPAGVKPAMPLRRSRGLNNQDDYYPLPPQPSAERNESEDTADSKPAGAHSAPEKVAESKPVSATEASVQTAGPSTPVAPRAQTRRLLFRRPGTPDVTAPDASGTAPGP